MEKEHNQAIGGRGEDLACEMLINMGHRILERNYRSGHLEIDIISVDADGIHFVEVKARKNNIQGNPEDNVNPAKQRKITKAALGFLNRKGKEFSSMECFFDIIAITFNGDEVNKKWIPQAFLPIYV